MGLPDKSPMSDLFHGTIYMTLGCSRSPVTVAVPSSSRSTPPLPLAAACPWGAPGAAPACWDAAAADPGRAPGAPGAAAGEVAALGSPASLCGEVLARGSPASLCGEVLARG